MSSEKSKMKKLKHILSLLLLISPLTAFAHGEEVLVTLFLEFIVVVILVIGLLTIKLNGTGKFIIGGIYVLAIVLSFMITNSLPYDQYRTMINIVVVVVPMTLGLISYVGLKNKFPKE
jgi:hypothetical protein